MFTLVITAILAVKQYNPPAEPGSDSGKWATVVVVVVIIIALSILAHFDTKDRFQAKSGEVNLELDQSDIDLSDAPAPEIKPADWNEMLTYRRDLRQSQPKRPKKLATGD